jgi:ATP-dependent DNA helicase RecQ
LTATATQKVIDDIRINLEMEDVQVFKKSFFRDNLAYQIFSLENKTDRLLKILNKNPHPTIIYTSSRRKTEELANYIDSKGFRTVSYHGGMSSDDKQNSFDLWMREERPIVVATNAFGMGIDKPNVRVVVHVDLPYSMENYIQEAGRGGRDGNKAFSVVLQNENDIAIFKRNTIENIPSLEEIKTVHSKLYQYFQIANGEKPETSFDFNLQEFCNRYSFNSKKVTGILHILKNHGIIDINHKFDTKSTVQFKVSSQQLINFQSKNQLTLQLIELLLRSYGTIFHQKAKISEFILAKKLKTTSTRIKKILKKLDEKEILEYKEVNANHDLFFLLPREDNHTIHRFSKSMKQYVHQQQKKAQQFIQFIRNDQVCRSQQILEYFGESFDKECGMCDVCIASKQKKQKMDVSKQLISLFSPKKELSKDEIVDQMELSEETIFIHLRNLLRRDILGLTEDNKLFLK